MISTLHLGRRSTPSLLLVNRQISVEAITLLYRTPFIINSQLPYQLQQGSNGIQDLVSESTLRRLRFVTLHLGLEATGTKYAYAKAWLTTIEQLTCIWRVECALERVIIHVRYAEPSRRVGWTFGQAIFHDNAMAIFEKVRYSLRLLNIGLIYYSWKGLVGRATWCSWEDFRD